MFQSKFVYFSLGLFSGYIIGSTSFLVIFLLVVIFFMYFKKEYSSQIRMPGFSNQSLQEVISFKGKNNYHKKIIQTSIRSDVYSEMMDYCKWKGESVDAFASKAALLIFTKDKDWKAYERFSKETTVIS